MAGRRSEINALGNHRYLEKKWKAQFFFTSAWNYIKVRVDDEHLLL